MQITEALFLAHCQCAYKGFLKRQGEIGEVVDYEAIQAEADAAFTAEAIGRWLGSHAGSRVLREPPSLLLAAKEGVGMILGAEVVALGMALRFDLLERHDDRDGDGQRLTSRCGSLTGAS